LRSRLHEFFAGNAELQVKLDSPPVSPSSGEESTSSPNQSRKSIEKPEASDDQVKKLICSSVEAIISLQWEFPMDHKTVGFDTATEASRLMLDGLTMLSGLKKRDDLAAQKVLAELDVDWVGILRFLSTMYVSKTRSTMQGRITNIVEKLTRWVPAFKAAVTRSPLGKHAAAPHVPAPFRLPGHDGSACQGGRVETEGAARKLVQEQRGKYAVQNCTERELVFFVEETSTEFKLQPKDLEVFQTSHESVKMRINKKGFFGLTSFGTTRLGEANLQHMAVHSVVAPSGRADDGVQCIMVA